MKKAFSILSIVIIAASLHLNAQSVVQTDSTTNQAKPQPEKQPQKKESTASKIYYGGTVGLTFGSYTRIGLYPLIGYNIAPKLSGALKLGYEYISDNRYDKKYTSSNYGASVIGRYRIIPAVYAHVEYEMFNYELYQSNGSSERDWVPFLYLGGGFSKKTSANSWVMAQVLFDVLQDENSPYQAGAPFFSVGIGVGF